MTPRTVKTTPSGAPLPLCTSHFLFRASYDNRDIRICKLSQDLPHCFCENIIRFRECPKGLGEV